VFNDAATFTKEELMGALSKAERIDAAELELGARLGSGSFGSVYRASWRPVSHPTAAAAAAKTDGRLEVAVKVFDTPKDPKLIEKICQEASLLAAARHEHVVSVHGLCVDADANLSLVMEHCAGGSLHDLLHEEPVGAPLDGRSIVRLLRGCASGMASLHARGIIHRDLKSANLLLDARHEHVKVCDFGLSRQAFETAAMTRVGSVPYVAPELILGLAYNAKADVWSFGVVTWEVITGERPFDGIPRAALARKVALEGQRLDPPPLDPQRCPIEMLRLMAACFLPERDRLSFAGVLNILDSIDKMLLAPERAHAAHGEPETHAAQPA
jgi:serine/threonine protein kinase